MDERERLTKRLQDRKARYWLTTIFDRETGEEVLAADSRDDCPGGDQLCGGCGACLIAQCGHAELLAKRLIYRLVSLECYAEQDGANTWVEVPIVRLNGAVNPDHLRRWSLEVIQIADGTKRCLLIAHCGKLDRDLDFLLLNQRDYTALFTDFVAGLSQCSADPFLGEDEDAIGH